MPGLVPARRSHSSLEEDDDGRSPSPSDGGTPPNQGANKRARTSTDGASRRTTNDSWRLDTPQTTTRPRQQRPQFRPGSARGRASVPPQQPQEHQPGAIIKVILKDFVTYSDVTFHPGPSLNMVIGPNGTGKSTLVCAICLGLGWGPKHLGRAKDPTEFIKHGSDKATIEIHLKGQPGKRDPVIKRQIDHNKTSTHWWINGKESSEKNARTLAESFNIQIDNLCQFLPQDRVAEFANLKPVDKLAATIRAAAPQEMQDQHERLKELRAKQSSAEKDLLGEKNSLAALERRHENQRSDVEKIRERQDVQAQVEFLHNFRKFAVYNEARTKHQKCLAQLNFDKAELAALEEEVEPNTRATGEKQEYAKQLKDVANHRTKLLDGIKRQLGLTEDKCNEVTGKIEACLRSRENENTSLKQSKQSIAKTKVAIDGLVNQHAENEPPAVDSGDYNERVRQKQRERVEVLTSMNELKDQKAALLEECRQKKARMDQAERDIKTLNTEHGQREKLLRSADPQVADAWDWVQQQLKLGDQCPFKGEVHGPPMIECSVEDEAWAGAIESLFNRSELTSITCTNAEDMRYLSDQLHGKGLPNVSLRQQNAPLDTFRPPVNDAEQQRLGISGWAVDYIKGPGILRAMLCSYGQAHKTAILDREESLDQYQMLTDSAVDSWMTKQKSTRITRRREYDASSTKTSLFKPAQYWISQPVDTAAIEDLRDNIQGWGEELEAKKNEGRQLESTIKQRDEKVKELETEAGAIEEEKAAKQKIVNEWKALPKKIDNMREKLAALQKAEEASIAKMQELDEKHAGLLLERANLALSHSTNLVIFRTAYTKLIEISIRLVEAESDVAHLKAKNQEIERILFARREAVQTLAAETETAKQRGKELGRVFKKLMRDVEGFEAHLETLSEDEKNRTPQQVDTEVEGLEARLGLLHGGNDRTLAEFEKRERDIAEMKRKIEDHDMHMTELADSIKDLRNNWEPKLDALIAQISEAFGAFFTRIRCAGEVSVYKAGPAGQEYAPDRDDDFANWSIMLKVKFREEEELSVLDSHRQSGGERAVSTMFYLMALQRLSRAPFRVVDEINQGMDPRNERVVHALMVDVACGDGVGDSELSRIGREQTEDDEEDNERIEPAAPGQCGYAGSQYFLITPKLLTNLKYKAGMKVHCIASGEYMPDDPMKLDLKSLIRKAAAAKAGEADGFGDEGNSFERTTSRGVSVGA